MFKIFTTTQNQKLTKKVELFIMQDGKLYQMGQDNRLRHCATTYEAQKILQEFHEGFTG